MVLCCFTSTFGKSLKLLASNGVLFAIPKLLFLERRNAKATRWSRRVDPSSALAVQVRTRHVPHVRLHVFTAASVTAELITVLSPSEGGMPTVRILRAGTIDVSDHESGMETVALELVHQLQRVRSAFVLRLRRTRRASSCTASPPRFLLQALLD